MSCQEIANEIPLYCYGEVSSETEEIIESHMAGCAACRAELERHRAFLDLLDTRPDGGDNSLVLAGCRARLRSAIETKKTSFWQWQIPFRVPVGAMALVALGFFGARFTPEKFGGFEASVAAPMFSSVRSVEPDSKSGQIRIAVDDIRRHVVSGTAQDPHIEALLLSAVREEANPVVRVASIRVLTGNADSEQVRQALVDALTKDPNANVRLKALEGLKPYGGDPLVRRTLANVLLKDDNPDVRIQAIDLLTTHHDDSIVGVLQDAVRKEDNPYVRTRSVSLLEQMKASVGTY
jgi:hypothetical protein